MAPKSKVQDQEQDMKSTIKDLQQRVLDLESAKATKATIAKPKTKRAAGPYALYVKANFGEMKTKNPDAKAPEIMSMIAAQWKAAKAN